MIVNCTRCGARFRIDSQQIGSRGRKVRCSACGSVWHQDPAPTIASMAAAELVPLDNNSSHDEQKRTAGLPDFQSKAGPKEAGENYDQLEDIEKDISFNEARENNKNPEQDDHMEDFFKKIDENLDQDKKKSALSFRRVAILALFSFIFAIVFTASLYFLFSDNNSVINSLWTASSTPLGEIFVLDSDKPAWSQKRQGKRSVLISGSLTNISESFQKSPKIRMNLLNKAGSVLPESSTTLSLADKEFAPGERQKFEHKIDDPHPEANEIVLSLER